MTTIYSTASVIGAIDRVITGGIIRHVLALVVTRITRIGGAVKTIVAIGHSSISTRALATNFTSRAIEAIIARLVIVIRLADAGSIGLGTNPSVTLVCSRRAVFDLSLTMPAAITAVVYSTLQTIATWRAGRAVFVRTIVANTSIFGAVVAVIAIGIYSAALTPRIVSVGQAIAIVVDVVRTAPGRCQVLFCWRLGYQGMLADVGNFIADVLGTKVGVAAISRL